MAAGAWGFLPVPYTTNPCPSKYPAKAAPIPFEAPVTRATFFSSLLITAKLRGL
jgi:hypothetical protein